MTEKIKAEIEKTIQRLANDVNYSFHEILTDFAEAILKEQKAKVEFAEKIAKVMIYSYSSHDLHLLQQAYGAKDWNAALKKLREIIPQLPKDIECEPEDKCILQQE